MRISTSDLRAITGILLDHLDHLGATEVEIPVDYYWHIARDELYNTNLENVHPDFGQLSEDWEKLEAIRDGTLPPVALALEWLGAVLRASGEQVVG